MANSKHGQCRHRIIPSSPCPPLQSPSEHTPPAATLHSTRCSLEGTLCAAVGLPCAMASQTLPVCHLQNSEFYLAARCLMSTIDFCFFLTPPFLTLLPALECLYCNSILGYNRALKEHKAWGGQPKEGNKPEACPSLCALGVLSSGSTIWH